MVKLEKSRRKLHAAVDALTRHIEEVDHFLASGEGDFHHLHEFRAMLQGIKELSEFVLKHEMRIEALKTPEGQAIVREALNAHRRYAPLASCEEHNMMDLEDTTFFLMWLIEFSPSSSCAE